MLILIKFKIGITNFNISSIMLLLLSYCSVFKVQNCENSFAAKPQVKFSLLTFLFTRK